MFSRTFLFYAYFSEYEGRRFVFSGDHLFGDLLRGQLSVEEIPTGYRSYGRTDDARQRMLVKDTVLGRASLKGEVFEYSLDSKELRGPLFRVGGGISIRGVFGEHAFLQVDGKKEFTRIYTLNNQKTLDLEEDYGFIVGSYMGDVIFKDLTSGNGRIIRADMEGHKRWETKVESVRETLLFAESGITVCAVWHPNPNQSTLYEKCDLLILDAETGVSIDTVALNEPLAWPSGQVVLDSGVLYARTTEALYAYDIRGRSTKCYPLPKVTRGEAFLVANGKAYVPTDENDDARLYVISATDGQMLGSRVFEGLSFHDHSSTIVRLEGGFAMMVTNKTETPGWRYTRVVTWRDGEMEDPNIELDVEPLWVEKERELVRRDSRYRVRMREPRSFVEVLRQMSVGIESAAYEAAIDTGDDTKAYDEDFAGELIADFSNQSLSDAQRAAVERMLDGIEKDELRYLKNAVDRGPLKITAIFA